MGMVLPEHIDCLLNGELKANYRFSTLFLKARLTEIVVCVKRSESMYLNIETPSSERVMRILPSGEGKIP